MPSTSCDMFRFVAALIVSSLSLIVLPPKATTRVAASLSKSSGAA